MSTKFVANVNVEHFEDLDDSEDEELKPETKEKTLEEIGISRRNVEDWNLIKQPPKKNLVDLLCHMITNYQNTNVQIRIGDVTFFCHMMVLQCYSDFFLNLTDQQVIILPIDKVKPTAFAMIYDWMLSSEPLIQRQGILELFNAAEFLKIEGLIQQCWACLDNDQHVREDVAFLLYLEARKYNHQLIKDLMLNRLGKFFLPMVASKEFLELTANEICTILNKNTIAVHTEFEVLMSAVRWINYDWEERKKHNLDIINCVRFGLMLPWQLLELKRSHDSIELERVLNNPKVQNTIDEGFLYVTARYWYTSEPQATAAMERLKLQPPDERIWIRDEIFLKDPKCTNQCYITYTKFLEYLEMLKSKGGKYWKKFEFFAENPNETLLRYQKSVNE